MSMWIDSKYIGLLSNRLERFSRKDNNLYNFRCPVCGDSQKNKLKSRGYVFENKGSLVFKCHNCGAGLSLGKLIERVDPNLYKEYSLESFSERRGSTGNNVPVYKPPQPPDITKIVHPKFMKGDSPLKQLKKISQLDHTHPAKQYCVKRKIPAVFHGQLFYAPKFQSWVNTYIPNKFKEGYKDEPRLIIPLLDYDGSFIGCTGRSFAPKSSLRYVTIIHKEGRPKVFGLSGIDFSKKVYVTEGPIDSMFLPNALAMAGADLAGINEIDPTNTVIIYDNERRNDEIIKRLEKMVDLGYNVCIWPVTIEQKDINEMVLAGRQLADIKLIVDRNTYSGLEAKLALTIWKKT
jgi:hypothetical protein